MASPYYGYGSPGTENVFYIPNQNEAHGLASPDQISGSIPMAGVSTGNVSRGPEKWWHAFTTGNYDGEPPLLEELEINFDHIRQKSLTVLNPLKTVDPQILDDSDLAGPLVYCFIFAMLLLLAGKSQFSYIYGVSLLGCFAIFLLLNVMSEKGIDAQRTASVLGYCLLPMVLLAVLNLVVSLNGRVGYILSAIAILWCSYSASAIFSTVLQMTQQRLLVAYPVGLLYTAFALLSIFDTRRV